MAIANLNDGATDISVGANWSDTIGFANDATLIIPRGSQTLTGLDVRGSTTTGIDYLHVSRGFSGNIGGGGTALQCDVDATYTTTPNIVFSGSGFMYFNPATTVAEVLVNGIGTFVQTGGTTTTFRCVSGSATVGESATATNAYLHGDGALTLEYSASIAATLVHVTGGGNCTIKREATTVTISGPGVVTINAPGETITTLNANDPGCRVVVLAGNVTTANVYGALDLSQANYASTVGGTAVNLYPTGTIIGEGNANITLSNVNRIAGGSFAGAGESTP